MRIGMGYDVHRLAENRKMIIGGVEIPYEKGLLGHSDADVLLHAIMDALLGAAALGDIGKHFPDTDPAYEGISSMKLLEKVGQLLEDNRYVIENIDATIIAQKPKMRPYIDTMRGKYRRSTWNRAFSGQCKGDHRGRTWFYGRQWKESAHRRSVCCSVRQRGVNSRQFMVTAVAVAAAHAGKTEVVWRAKE